MELKLLKSSNPPRTEDGLKLLLRSQAKLTLRQVVAEGDKLRHGRYNDTAELLDFYNFFDQLRKLAE